MRKFCLIFCLVILLFSEMLISCTTKSDDNQSSNTESSTSNSEKKNNHSVFNSQTAAEKKQEVYGKKSLSQLEVVGAKMVFCLWLGGPVTINPIPFRNSNPITAVLLKNPSSLTGNKLLLLLILILSVCAAKP